MRNVQRVEMFCADDNTKTQPTLRTISEMIPELFWNEKTVHSFSVDIMRWAYVSALVLLISALSLSSDLKCHHILSAYNERTTRYFLMHLVCLWNAGLIFMFSFMWRVPLPTLENADDGSAPADMDPSLYKKSPSPHSTRRSWKQSPAVCLGLLVLLCWTCFTPAYCAWAKPGGVYNGRWQPCIRDTLKFWRLVRGHVFVEHDLLTLPLAACADATIFANPANPPLPSETAYAGCGGATKEQLLDHHALKCRDCLRYSDIDTCINSFNYSNVPAKLNQKALMQQCCLAYDDSTSWFSETTACAGDDSFANHSLLMTLAYALAFVLAAVAGVLNILFTWTRLDLKIVKIAREQK